MKIALGTHRMRGGPVLAGLALALTCGLFQRAGASEPAYDFSVLRINEVIANNNTQLPADGVSEFRDMLEIYNAGDDPLPLAGKAAEDRLALSDRVDPPPDHLWTFDPGGYSNIPSRGYIVVFLDNRPGDSLYCQLYASFGLKNDGSEPIVLWGPALRDGEGNVIVDPEGYPVREVIDLVWLPPLPADVSYGRDPEDPGPASKTTEEAVENAKHFHLYPPGESSFGVCAATCPYPVTVGVCSGAQNGSSPGNLKPHVERTGSALNNPAAEEPVELRARVDDNELPTPADGGGSIAEVLIHYWVDGNPQPDVQMEYDAQKGVQTHPERPLVVWTEWTGTIPGQPAGSVVEFVLEVRDKEGLWDKNPGNLCSELVWPGPDPAPPRPEGPCDREFGGTGCWKDTTDITCDGQAFGTRYVACDVPFRYLVGYTPRGDLANIVINEVVPHQGLEVVEDGSGGFEYKSQGVLRDRTEPDCVSLLPPCPEQYPECCKYEEDFIELLNVSQTDPVDLSGLWLSDSPFRPHSWKFPPGSVIAPREYVIVWLDNDGGKCPDPDAPFPPCFWECPDPTDPARSEYHANFAVDAERDQVYLFDTEENRFGVVHGVEFEAVQINQAYSLIPDGSRSGTWRIGAPTPREANVGCPEFLRGDTNMNRQIDLTDPVNTLEHLFLSGPDLICPDAADGDDNGKIEITDAIFVLSHLFLSGPEPPPPGAEIPGCDPTPDELEPCDAFGSNLQP